MDYFQAEDYHTLLVFEASQVSVDPHIYAHTPICFSLGHLQLPSKLCMQSWQQYRSADDGFVSAGRPEELEHQFGLQCNRLHM